MKESQRGLIVSLVGALVILVIIGAVFYSRNYKSLAPTVGQNNTNVFDQNSDVTGGTALTQPASGVPNTSVTAPKATPVPATSPKSTSPKIAIVNQSTQFQSSAELTTGGSVPLIVYVSYDKDLGFFNNGIVHAGEYAYIRGSNFGSCRDHTTTCKVKIFIDQKPVTVQSLTPNLIKIRAPQLSIDTHDMYITNIDTKQNSNPVAFNVK